MSPPLARTDHLLTAASWIQSALLGSIATTIAVIAIAAVGLAMLNGRLELRRGLVVVLGCFVLFGAPAIANGLLRLIPASATVAPPVPPPASLPAPAPKPTAAYDPYAGAAVPRAR